jgi:hypothetical protein
MSIHSRIFPSWEQISNLKNFLTEGERALLNFLDENLPFDVTWKEEESLHNYKGWLIFVQPYLNNTRPDIVIFHPWIGVVIYEVKDWDLNLYQWGNNGEGTQLFVTNGIGRYPVLSPINQVNHYKEKIISQLVPIIGEAIDYNKKNYSLIKTAIYFHKATTESAQELFNSKIKDKKNFPLFGRDFLTTSNIGYIVPEFKYSYNNFWDTKWNIELLFWLKPPYHTIEQGMLLSLRGKQLDIAIPRTGHFRVRGVAGSGKTQALAYRAAHLASKNKKVLILSFNITLWHYIRDMIQRAPFNFSWEQITFNHFHGFCKDKLNRYGYKWPHGPQAEDFNDKKEYEDSLEDMFKSDIPSYVINAKNEWCINQERVEYEKYDAILIDEGQDYYYEWYEMLHENYLSNEDEVLIVCDKKQNIYEREMDWLDKRVTRKGLEKFITPYIDLTTTFRMPRIVAEMSNDFSELFNLNQDLKVSKIEPSPVLFKPQHIVWREINMSDWLENIHNAFKRLKKEEYHPSEIVILLPDHKIGAECVTYFKELNIDVNHVFDLENGGRYHKKSFWMGDSRLKMSTIHSFKGWELLNIVLLIPDSYSSNIEKLDAIIYTAMTRTRENLIVINSNSRYSDFGKQFPITWN